MIKDNNISALSFPLNVQLDSANLEAENSPPISSIMSRWSILISTYANELGHYSSQDFHVNQLDFKLQAESTLTENLK